MAHLDKVPETPEGLQTLYDTTQGATDERFVAGIQCKRTKIADILKLTNRLRDSRGVLESELLRLADFANAFNKLYATKNNKWFNTAEIMLKKIQSHYLRWREILKFTSPKKSRKKRKPKKEETIYETTSFNRNRPIQSDAFGMSSYDYQVGELKNELRLFLGDMVKGIKLCQAMLNEEDKIKHDPEWIKEIYEDCYNMVVAKNRETIDWLHSMGLAHEDNPLYQLMIKYNDKEKFIEEQFHEHTDTRFSDFVIADVIMTLMNNNINATEQQLWGKDYEKIKMVRFAIDNFNLLVTPHGRKGYCGADIMEFIIWCDVIKDPNTREDEERILYDYLKDKYKGGRSMVEWSSVFSARKDYTQTIKDQIKMSFNEKVTNLFEEQHKKEIVKSLAS
ncbi:MAG: hypothetical protein IJ546_02835 [Prevotella sp.]|nr:hypothetical protein [Prevotella sp.]